MAYEFEGEQLDFYPHERMNPSFEDEFDSFVLRPFFGLEIRGEVYKEFLDQGYHFRTNASEEDRDEIVRKYESSGLEVAVHPRAFCMDGSENPGAVAILVREKKQGQPINR